MPLQWLASFLQRHGTGFWKAAGCSAWEQYDDPDVNFVFLQKLIVMSKQWGPSFNNNNTDRMLSRDKEHRVWSRQTWLNLCLYYHKFWLHVGSEFLSTMYHHKHNTKCVTVCVCSAVHVETRGHSPEAFHLGFWEQVFHWPGTCWLG